MDTVKTLVIRFRNEIALDEIPLFRGAVIKTIDRPDILFHNHIGENGFRYSYPLIQYHRIGGRAAIVCIGDGVDAIGEFFSNFRSEVIIGSRKEDLVIDNVNAMRSKVMIWDTMFSYNIRKWLPLNGTNYINFKNLDSMADKSALMEKIFIGNVLSFAKGTGIHINNEILCNISWANELKPVDFKDIRLRAFDVSLKTNISLPSYIGIGKGASLGFGTITRIQEKTL